MIELHVWCHQPCTCQCSSLHDSGWVSTLIIFTCIYTFYSNDEVRLCNELRSKQSTLIKICLIVSSIFTAGVWSCPATTGERPPPCAGHTFTAVDDRRAVVFGGKYREQGRMNVFIIDLSTMVFKWHVGTMRIKNLEMCPFISECPL